MSDEVELPPLDADPDEWAEKWDQPTTITVNRWVKAHLDHDRQGQPWNEYLESLRQLKADPLTYSEVEAIADRLEERVNEAVKEVLEDG